MLILQLRNQKKVVMRGMTSGPSSMDTAVSLEQMSLCKGEHFEKKGYDV